MPWAEGLLLDVQRALERRLGLGESARAHVDIREKIERLAHRGAVPTRGLLADHQRALIIVLRLGVTAFPVIGIAEIFERIAHDHLISVRRAFDNAERALLHGLRLGIASLVLVDAPEAVECLREIAGRCRAWPCLLEDCKRRLVELLRFRILAEDVERSRLQEKSAGIALVLRPVSCPRRAFELACLGEGCVIITRLEKLIVAFHKVFELGLRKARKRSRREQQHQQQGCWHARPSR